MSRQWVERTLAAAGLTVLALASGTTDQGAAETRDVHALFR